MRLYYFGYPCWVYICESCFYEITKENPIKPGDGYPRKDNRTKVDIQRYINEAKPYTDCPSKMEVDNLHTDVVYYIPS